MTPSNKESAAFQPHFIDLIIARVERFSMPYLLFYILLFFAVGVIFIVIAWLQGFLDVGVIELSYFVFGTWIAENLFINHFLTSSSLTSLSEFKTQLNITDSELEKLQYSISHIPRFRANLWSIVGLFVGFVVVLYLKNLNVPGIHSFPITYLAISSSFGASFWFAGGYRAFRQLRIISQLFDSIENVNIHDLSSIYGLAIFPAKVVFVVILFLYANPAFILFPEMFSDPYILVLWGFMTISSLGIAVLPLRGINQKLSEEKDRLLMENGLRLDLATEALYNQVDSGEHQKLDKLERGINALIAVRKDIETVSTWPWKTDTIRWLATALILPLGLWIIQFSLQLFFAS